MYVNPEIIVELADLYKRVGHAGHAMWHRNSDIPIPCNQCPNKTEATA